MSVQLKDQVALITGASRGIGRGVALRFAKEGMHVALVARNAEGLEETARQCRALGVKAHVLPCDLTDVSRTKGLVNETVKTLGKLTVLVNNAGQINRAPVGEGDLEKWDEVLDLNVKALMHLTHHAVAALAKAAPSAIINIASVSSKITHAGGALYCATKHAVLGYSNALFEDVREKGIKVSALCPGYVNTEMAADQNLNLDRAIQVEDIADAIVWVLRSPATVCPTEMTLRPQRTPFKS